MMPGMAGTLAGLDHALLDVGEGRRLERFGSIIVDRPWPPVEGSSRADPAAWRAADARFDRMADGPVVHAGWTTRDGRPIEPWTIVEDGLRCELRLAPSGQVGLFPEQAANRAWLRQAVEVMVGSFGSAQPAEQTRRADPGELPQVLNLFAYTGLGTLRGRRLGPPQRRTQRLRRTTNPLDRRRREDLCPPRGKARAAVLRHRPGPAELRPQPDRTRLAARARPAKADRRLRAAPRRAGPGIRRPDGPHPRRGR